MKRPVGIVLSAIALGLIAGFLLLLALGGMVTSLNGPSFANSAAASGLPSPAMYSAVLLVMTLLYLALAVWSTFTLVGLLRMRSWARVSAMVIAVGIGILGFFSVLGMMAVSSALSSGSFPIPPNVPSAVLHKVIVFMAAASLVVAALACGWLIYLAQRRTRQAFAEAQALREGRHPSYPPGDPNNPAQPGYPAAAPYGPAQPVPWIARRPSPPNPLTDFTVARPVAPPSGPPAPVAYDYPPAAVPGQPYAAPYGQPQAPPVPAARPRAGRPASVTVLSVFALIDAFLTIFAVVSPRPGFLFGLIVSGWPLHLYGLVFTAALAICGLGMLRLQRPAWLLSFALLAINMLNFLVCLLPGPRARYAGFIAAQQQAMFGGQQPTLPANIMAMSMALGMLIGAALMVLFAILLWRARWAFEPKPAPPPLDETPTA